MDGLVSAAQAHFFLLLAALPVGVFVLAFFLGTWDTAKEDDDGPEIDLDGEAGPPV